MRSVETFRLVDETPLLEATAKSETWLWINMTIVNDPLQVDLSVPSPIRREGLASPLAILDTRAYRA